MLIIFFFKQKTAYEIASCLVGSEMCIRDSIICIGQLVNAMTGSVGLLLNMTGNQHVFSKSNMLFLGINIALSIPAVLYFQVTGAAMAYTIILALQNITLVWYVKKHLNINTAIV